MGEEMQLVSLVSPAPPVSPALAFAALGGLRPSTHKEF